LKILQKGIAGQELQSKDVTNKTQQAKVLIKCAECAKTFSKACELEEHMEEHEKPKDFKCETCGKEFFLEWRLKKHANNHSGNSRRCKYVENKAECPFERIGCMFKHEKPD
jgi:DNA-directed RNA polymerase subunit RPC12/RpoP